MAERYVLGRVSTEESVSFEPNGVHLELNALATGAVWCQKNPNFVPFDAGTRRSHEDPAGVVACTSQVFYLTGSAVFLGCKCSPISKCNIEPDSVGGSEMCPIYSL